ncbi:GNAT family N-acetyltransferase [Streptomyces sp. NPDC094032]|uniref:GNAT family N-acetyltransferase n=1 Tax=Streptomyces sp. NPDC094032 TaxID=3155308 RepID=UPI0033224320
MNDTTATTATTHLRVGASTPTPSLLLRPWSMDDAAALVEAFEDPVLRKWTTSGVRNEADAKRWVRTQEDGWAAGTRYSLAVLETTPADPDHGRLAGNVVLKRAAAAGHTAEVGYWTAAHARGRGVAPRALEALTAWAFHTFEAEGLTRLELLHQVDNQASCRVAEKTGYTFDHLLPATPPAYPLDGHLHTRHIA